MGTQTEDGPEFTQPMVTMDRGTQCPDITPHSGMERSSTAPTAPGGEGDNSNNDDGADGGPQAPDSSTQNYETAPGVNRFSGTLPKSAAESIVKRGASRAQSLPPTPPQGMLGVQPANTAAMTVAGFTHNIKRDDHQSWFDFQLSITNKFVHEKQQATTTRKPTPGRVSRLRGRHSRVPLYQAMVNECLTLVSKEEYRQMFPQQKNLPITAVVAANKRVTTKLRRCLSKRYRQYADTQAQIVRCRQKGKPQPKPLKPPRLTRTIDALIDLYFDDAMQEGSCAMPDRVDETDPEDTDDEFYTHVISREPQADGGSTHSTLPAGQSHGTPPHWNEMRKTLPQCPPQLFHRIRSTPCEWWWRSLPTTRPHSWGHDQ